MIVETRNGLSREDVEACIADWRGRLEDLYSRIDSWRKELRPDSKAKWGEVTQRLEEPMAKTGVHPGPLPPIGGRSTATSPKRSRPRSPESSVDAR